MVYTRVQLEDLCPSVVIVPLLVALYAYYPHRRLFGEKVDLAEHKVGK